MEKWQRQHIQENLYELCSLTIFNTHVNQELLRHNLICEADVEKFVS